MKFAVGYQTPQNGERFSDIVKTYRDHISEVYFAWPGMASGRPTGGIQDWGAQRRLEEELSTLRRMGVKLDLLLNGNCYGGDAISSGLQEAVIGLLEYLAAHGCCPEIVTTTSPFIAHIIKEECAGIEIRASVNMRIGTIQALEYASTYFDSFYLQRDYQRDLSYVRKVSQWAKETGKKICMLANSGCLRFCPSQTFHDNLIAHSHEAENRKVPGQEDFAAQFMPGYTPWNPHLCRTVYSDPKNYGEFLKETWIRPEDLSRYEGLVEVVKLATRQHSHPRMVLGAYCAGAFDGNLLELMEPGFASQFFPHYIDNSKFPADWAETTGKCTQGCTGCGYCEQVLKEVLGTYQY